MRARTRTIAVVIVVILAVVFGFFKNYAVSYALYFTAMIDDRTTLTGIGKPIRLPDGWWKIRDGDSATLFARLPLNRERRALTVAITPKSVSCSRGAAFDQGGEIFHEDKRIEFDEVMFGSVETCRTVWIHCQDLNASCIDIAWDVPKLDTRIAAFGISKPEMESIATVVALLANNVPDATTRSQRAR